MNVKRFCAWLALCLSLLSGSVQASIDATPVSGACSENCLSYAALWGVSLPWFNSPEALVAWTKGQTIYWCRADTAYVRPHPTVRDAWQVMIAGKWAPQYTQACSAAHNLSTRQRAPDTVTHTCPANSTLSNGSCTCNPGYSEDVDSGTCKAAATPILVASAPTAAPTDPNCSNPINGAGGNKYQHEIDLIATPESPLAFERHYNAVVSLSRSLSRGWRHTYDRMLIAVEPELGSSAYAYRPDGRIAAFVRTESGWEPQAHVLDRLVDVMVDGQRQWQLLNHQDNSTEVYNARGYLLAIVHANGRRLTLAYDHLDRIVSVTDVLSGRQLRFTHTGPTSHRIATLTTPDGGVIRYGYSEAAGFPQLTTVTYPGSATVSRQYRYNEAEHTGGANLPNALTGILDGAGTRIARYAYDAQGRGILSEHAGGVNRHTLAYNADGSTTVTDALGTARVYRYTDINGRLRQTSVSQPPGAGCGAASAARTYDAFGNIARSTDFKGVVTTQAWEGQRALNTETIEGAGSENPRTTRTQWHPHWHLPLRLSKPGQRFTYRYNGDPSSGGLACAPAAAVVPDGLGTRAAPLLCELTVQATDDASGAFGFAAPLTGASQTWRFSWGGAGQLLSIQGPGNQSTTATYAANGDLSSTTNPAGHTVSILSRDGAGRPLSVREGNGSVVTLAWTPRGELLSRSVAAFTTTYQRDANNRLTGIRLPDGSQTTLSYDLAGRLTGFTQPDGSQVRFTLDLMGRTIQTDWLQANGSLSRSERSSFDALGREQSRTVRRNGREYTTHFQYDANGQLHTLTDPKLQITRFAHDALGRLSQITDPLAGLTRFSHDGLDQLTGLQAPNNATTRFSIDGLGRVHLEDSPDRGQRQASFDAVGNPTRLTDARGIVEQRAYDALNRLTQVSWPGSSTSIGFTWDSAEGCSLGIGRLCAVADAERGVRYAYDARGNRLSETRTDQQGVTYTTTYTYDAADRLVSIGYLTPTRYWNTLQPHGGSAFRLDLARAQRVLREGAVVLHPFPRLDELDVSLDASSFNGYHRQLAGANAVRARALRLLLEA